MGAWTNSVKDSRGGHPLLCSWRAFAACFVPVNNTRRMTLASVSCSWISTPTNIGGAECGPMAERPFGAWRSASSQPATYLHSGQGATSPSPEEQFLCAPPWLMCALVSSPLADGHDLVAREPSTHHRHVGGPCPGPRGHRTLLPEIRSGRDQAPLPANRLRLRAAGPPR